MADKESLDIVVRAVADESSGVKAGKDIDSSVKRSVKGGRIEIPVDTKVLIDKGNKTLTKAQKAIVTELSKMMTEGFSASGKDIDQLTSKLKVFLKAAKDAGKDKRNPIVRTIADQAKAIESGYKALKQEEKRIRTYEAKSNSTKSRTKSKNNKYNPDFGIQKGEIEAQLNKERKRKEKDLSDITKKLGYTQEDAFNSSRPGTQQSLIATDRGGGHDSPYLRQTHESEKISRKKNKHVKTTQLTKEKMQAELDRLDEEYGIKDKFKTPTEEAVEISGLLIKQLPSLISRY